MKTRRLLFLAIAVLAAAGTMAQEADDDFPTTEKYYSDEMGTRLVVSPDVAKGSRIRDIELRLLDETFFDHAESEFATREIATITGGGLGSPGLLFHIDNPRGREEFIRILEEFQRKAAYFRDNRRALADLEESWMGTGGATLNQSRVLAELQTDFIDRPSKVTLNWDLEANRLWLSVDGFINIDSRIVEPLLQLIQRIPAYSRQRARYSAEIASKRVRIDELLDVRPAE
ncbi:MAG: hypothetical protein ACLFRP_00085 [Puniceicoccaceae bacterium]